MVSFYSTYLSVSSLAVFLFSALPPELVSTLLAALPSKGNASACARTCSAFVAMSCFIFSISSLVTQSITALFLPLIGFDMTLSGMSMSVSPPTVSSASTTGVFLLFYRNRCRHHARSQALLGQLQEDCSTEQQRAVRVSNKHHR